MSLETIEGGALCQLADPSTPQIIFQNPVLPITPAGVGGTIWDVTTGWIGVPAEKLEEYRAWYVSSVGGDVGKQGFIGPRVKAYNTVTVTNGTSPYTVAVENISVPIVADAPASGMMFSEWTSTEVTSFGDKDASTTTFTMPGTATGPVTVTANYVSDPSTSIKESEAVSVSVYPNPAVDVILVKGLGANAGYKIIDVMGKAVQSGSSYNGESINVASLPAGVYLLQSANVVVKFIKK